MKILKIGIDVFWFSIFILGIIPIFEALIWLAKSDVSIFSHWNVYALLWGVLTTEADIRFFDYISHRKWWVEKILPKFEKVFRKESRNHIRMKKIIKDLEYAGLIVSTSFMNMGKIGVVIYVNSRIALRFGRVALYIGNIFRVIITYYVLSGASSIGLTIGHF